MHIVAKKHQATPNSEPPETEKTMLKPNAPDNSAIPPVPGRPAKPNKKNPRRIEQLPLDGLLKKRLLR